MPPGCISELDMPDSFRVAVEESMMVLSHGLHVVNVILQINIRMLQLFQYLDQLFAIVNQETGHIFCVNGLENGLDTLVKENIGGVNQVACEGFHVLVETVGFEAAAGKNVDEFWTEDICIFGGFVNGIDEVVAFRRHSGEPFTSVHQVACWYVDQNQFKPRKIDLSLDVFGRSVIRKLDFYTPKAAFPRSAETFQ